MIEVIKDKLSESEVLEDKGEICTVIPLGRADVVIRSSSGATFTDRSRMTSDELIYSIKINGIDIRRLLKDKDRNNLYKDLADAVYSNIHATLESYVMDY